MSASDVKPSAGFAQAERRGELEQQKALSHENAPCLAAERTATAPGRSLLLLRHVGLLGVCGASIERGLVEEVPDALEEVTPGVLLERALELLRRS